MSRMIFRLCSLLCFALPALVAQNADEARRMRAEELSRKLIIVDTHIDAPDMLREHWEDISKRTERGEFDYPRAKAGGLSAPFMAIYIPPEEEKQGTAKRTADMLIDMVEGFAKSWPEKFAVAESPRDVTRIFKEGKISLCMGMENGAPIENESDVQHYYERGIRYVTLTHARDNHICDSSYDTTRTWHGLSPFGKKLVLDLNRKGIMVDVSHISDDAFYQVINISKAPVIASHSACRFFTPGFERNMSDDMIKLLALNGGIIQMNFGSEFVSKAYRDRDSVIRGAIRDSLRANGLGDKDSVARAYARDYRKTHPIAHADIADVVASIDHVVKLVGIDHVGIGSDFDGLGDELPVGLEDVSKYPNLIYALLKAGYSDRDIEKICSGNILRVWSEVAEIARNLQSQH